MRFVEPTSQQPADELDGLLRAFFRSQMPKPWPKPQLPRTAAARDGRRSFAGRTLIRSRWALAASLALLMLGSLLLPGRFTSTSKPENALPGNGTAERSDLPDAPKGRHGGTNDNKNKPENRADDDMLPDIEESDMPMLK